MAQSVRGVSEVLREVYLLQSQVRFLQQETLLFKEWMARPKSDAVVVARFWTAM